MTKNIQENNKRIAKNSLMLFFRMILLLVVGLYMSRVILNALGVSDFGLYNVVGGVLTMFTFLNNAMSGATQRYLNFALGKNDEVMLHTTFCTGMLIHIILALAIIVLGETLGLWFLNYKLSIPPDRLLTSNWLYQFSILSVFISITSIPYTSCIIAHEKMGAFAYFSIGDAIFKLGIAFLIDNYSGDRLLVYGGLLLLQSIIMRLLYNIYSRKHFSETKFNLIIDKQLLNGFGKYVGWSSYANLSTFAYGQGLNVLLNIFFGPIVNAARGIAYTVQSNIKQFVSSFQTAVNPQIVKYYAQGDYTNLYRLIFRSSKLSYYLMLIAVLPIWLGIDVVLKVWLKDVPENTEIFTKLVLIASMIEVITNPLTTATKATSNLKKNSILGGTNLLIILPISYLFLKFGFPAETVFYVMIVVFINAIFIRLYICNELIRFPWKMFLQKIVIKCWFVTLVTAIIPFLVNSVLPRTLLYWIILCIITIPLTLLIIYFIDLEKSEKKFVKGLIMKIKK